MHARLSVGLPSTWPGLLLLIAVCGCGGSPVSPGTTPAPATPTTGEPASAAVVAPTAKVTAAPTAPARSPFRFEALSTAGGSGIDFVHVSGMTPARHFPTANGSGLAIFDYDGDGKMDLYFASCNTLPLEARPKASNRLYKNLGDGHFLDVTEKAGVGFRGFTHGVIAGDLDNDGDGDLILCNYGVNVVYLNNGDGTFRDASKEAGFTAPNWSSGGALLDFDNDGDLDVYITNYGKWDIATDGERFCGSQAKKVRQYCSPRTITPVPHLFYRNDLKDGVPHFTECLKAVGLGREDGRGFGVVASDLNDDGKIDLYVANDQCPAFVFYNNGDGTFRDATGESGAAFNADGNTESGMGVDAEDYDGDGLVDLLRTNFREETTSLYQNQGNGFFLEQSGFNGVKAEAIAHVKWGCGLVDFDNDGWPDLFVTNGHVDDNLHLNGVLNQPHRELPTLMASVKGKTFTPAGRGAGPFFEEGHVGRGVAFGDLDDDGRADIVVNHKDDSPGVLLNRTEGAGHWLRLALKGTTSNRDAIGARVDVLADGRTIRRQKKGGGSLESTNDPRLLVGVGAAQEVKVVVRWPSGSPDTILEKVAVDQTLAVTESAAKR